MEHQAGGTQLEAIRPPSWSAIPAQAESDEHLIDLWLYGRSARTLRAYRADLAAFRAHVAKPLRAVTIGDLQSFADSLAGRAAASQAARLAAIKSLFGFAHRIGYVAFNVGAALKLPKIEGKLAQRILSERSVHKLLEHAKNPRDAAILGLLYYGGLRISEIASLDWRHLQERGEAGQLTVFGKGGKTRAVLLKPAIWRQLIAMRGNRGPDEPVFTSSKVKGGRMDASAIHRIVKHAAARAGLSVDVSAHWLRHAHVSHALDHGAAPHLVQSTVGHANLATTSRYAHARPGDSSSLYLPD